MSEETGAGAPESKEGVIRVMSETLANKIAAGEVVQRPANVLKELLENSLDAGARSIEIVVKDAGSELVQVIDDGCGMGPADARRSFRRHATSKIQAVEDLETLHTFGFRGEALASIAAVSRVRLQTRRRSDGAGTLLRVEGGERVEERPCAAREGTSVEVRHLFYNVPARRNFLKTPATELKHLLRVAQNVALAEPDLAMRFEHNGYEHFDLPAGAADQESDRLRERIEALFDTATASDLVEVADESSYVSLRGWIATPRQGKRKKRDQYLFVNGRPIRDRYLSHAVRKAYGERLKEGAFPFFVLFLEVAPDRVDVNVHPSKEEVKFEDEQGVYGFLRSAVSRALRTDELGSGKEELALTGQAEGGVGAAGGFSLGGASHTAARPEKPSRSTSNGAPSRTRRSGVPSSRGARTAQLGAQTDELYRPVEDAHEEAEQPTGAGRLGYDGEPIRPFGGRYLSWVAADAIVLLDACAAHRRILYERALEHLAGADAPSQRLLFPATVELAPTQAALLEEYRDELTRLGFDFNELSGRSVVLRAVPAAVRETQMEATFVDLLDALDGPEGVAASDHQRALARHMARQGAIRSVESLRPEVVRRLLDDLAACEMPYVDPGGQRTILKVTAEEVERRFDHG